MLSVSHHTFIFFSLIRGWHTHAHLHKRTCTHMYISTRSSAWRQEITTLSASPAVRPAVPPPPLSGGYQLFVSRNKRHGKCVVEFRTLISSGYLNAHQTVDLRVGIPIRERAPPVEIYCRRASSLTTLKCRD